MAYEKNGGRAARWCRRRLTHGGASPPSPPPSPVTPVAAFSPAPHTPPQAPRPSLTSRSRSLPLRTGGGGGRPLPAPHTRPGPFHSSPPVCFLYYHKPRGGLVLRGAMTQLFSEGKAGAGHVTPGGPPSVCVCVCRPLWRNVCSSPVSLRSSTGAPHRGSSPPHRGSSPPHRGSSPPSPGLLSSFYSHAF